MTLPNDEGMASDGTALEAILRLRVIAFALVGIALPLFAFPVARIANRDVDLATIAAGAFVLLTFAARPKWERNAESCFIVAAATVPLLALLGPRLDHYYPGGFARTYAHWLLVVLVFYAARSIPFSKRSLEKIVTAQSVVAILVALFAIYQIFAIPRGWPGGEAHLLANQREPLRFTRIGGTFQGGGYVRPTSIFLEPAWLGGYLAWILALRLAISIGAKAKRMPEALLGMAALLFPALALLATVSWGAYGDFAVVLGVTIAVHVGRRRRPALRTAALLAAAVVGFLMFSSPGRVIRAAVAERWTMMRTTPTSGDDVLAARDSTWIRMQNVRLTLRLVEERPLRGIGLGQFSRSADLLREKVMKGLSFRDPWCGWLAIAAEEGILGPLILLGAIGTALWGWKLAGALGTAVPALAVLMAFQQLHTGSYVDLWWWYPLSLAAAITRSGVEASRTAVSDADLAPRPITAPESPRS